MQGREFNQLFVLTVRNMGKSSTQKNCFLFVLCYLLCRCPTDAAEDERQARHFLIYLNQKEKRYKKTVILCTILIGYFKIFFQIFICYKYWNFAIQVYIVYMGAIPEEHRSLHHSKKLQEEHLQMLQQVLVDGRLQWFDH